MCNQINGRKNNPVIEHEKPDGPTQLTKLQSNGEDNKLTNTNAMSTMFIANLTLKALTKAQKMM